MVDLEVVRRNYEAFARALPDSRIFYAVKANPAPEMLSLLASLGSSFDAASVPEIEMVLGDRRGADRISYGNTIKKERDIARAHALGVTLFAVDCVEEVEKISRAAPGARVFCRILTDGAGAEWPLSRKFGCVAEEAVDMLARATELGLVAHGVSFHVGSQQTDTKAWDRALRDAAACVPRRSERGMQLAMLNLGGGFPTRYLKDVPAAEDYGRAIFAALRKHFGNRIPETIIEPGRGMVGDAGVLKAEVVLISKKSRDGQGALGLSRRRKVRRARRDDGRGDPLPDQDGTTIDGWREGPCVVAGPTCDSTDVLYEKLPYDLPLVADDRRRGADRRHRRLHDHILCGGLQRLRAAAVLRDLTASVGGRSTSPADYPLGRRPRPSAAATFLPRFLA